ncbi:putative aminotransferase family protein [Xylariales sp. PMI_506]|nr:putative aminotransferase family protein [Xylariales sp. PMI_506]
MAPPQVPFGAPMRHAHFAFSPSYLPLNHGSYGTHPVSVRAAHLALRAEVEGAPDPFIALHFSDRLAQARALAADMLRCPRDELVFVPNATTGIDTVLMNLVWQPGDVVLCYELVYNAVADQLSWLAETKGVEISVLRRAWPVPDDELVSLMVAAARSINAQPGKRLRLAICDTIISGPGARVPFERLVPALQAEGALVLVDGAHGIGHIDLDLGSLRPDFFVTNLHKWLFVPRGCAAFHVPKRHQALIRTSLPTSHGFRPKKRLMQQVGNAFEQLFDFTGTADTTNWLCVEAALAFRQNVCGGEQNIREYCYSMAQRGAEIAAELFGTYIMDVPGSDMRKCNFANVRMPLDLGTEEEFETPRPASTSGKIDPRRAREVSGWIQRVGCAESGIYFQNFLYRGDWWWRISGMIYLEESDFRTGAEVLNKLCARVRDGEYLQSGAQSVVVGAEDRDFDSDTDSSPPATPIEDSSDEMDDAGAF